MASTFRLIFLVTLLFCNYGNAQIGEDKFEIVSLLGNDYTEGFTEEGTKYIKYYNEVNGHEYNMWFFMKNVNGSYLCYKIRTEGYPQTIYGIIEGMEYVKMSDNYYIDKEKEYRFRLYAHPELPFLVLDATAY